MTMTIELTAKTPTKFTETDETDETALEEHICATCQHKERVYVTSPDGAQFAAIWRCRELSQRFRQEILVKPTGSCYESKSLSDYWEPQEDSALVW